MTGSRTISMTDLTQTATFAGGGVTAAAAAAAATAASSLQVSSNLKFSLRGSELNMNNLTKSSTPKQMENFLTIPSQSGNDIQFTIFGNNEVVDFESEKYTQKPARSKSASERPLLTFQEIKTRAPQLFRDIRKVSMDKIFHVEDCYANNLQRCYENICPEDKYSEIMLLGPLKFEVFLNNRSAFTKLSNKIMQSLNSLKLIILNLNEYLSEEFNAITISLKWEIFSNASTIKDFENARPMFEAFLKFKNLFNHLIHETEYWVRIDECVVELSDLVFDWNELIKEAEEDKCMLQKIKPSHKLVEGGFDGSAIKNNFSALCTNVFQINSAFTEGSDFIKMCSFFPNKLQEVKSGFTEFIDHYRNSYSENGIFTYEICSLDDHFKEIVRSDTRDSEV